jgi:hypothetical protein
MIYDHLICIERIICNNLILYEDLITVEIEIPKKMTLVGGRIILVFNIKLYKKPPQKLSGAVFEIPLL